MAQKVFAGISIDVNDEGYMTNSSQWTKDIAREIAKEEGIELTDRHYSVIEFLSERQAKGESLTNRSVGTSGFIDNKGFYQLFPGAPLKKATKIAGIPKPVSCI